jgi:hypothetical protein
MKQEILSALEAHFAAHVLKHKTNINIMLANPLSIHDHTDFMGAVEKELEQLVEYQDKLEALRKHFIGEK